MYQKRKLKISILLISLLLIFLGAIFLYMPCSKLAEWNKFKKTAQKTDAVITEIDRRESTYYSRGRRRHRVHYDVYVSYAVGDSEYTSKLDYHKAGMREGDRVSVLYDPQNPSYTMSNPTAPALAFFAIAGVMLAIGLYLAGKEIRIYKYANQLIAMNSYVICDQWKDVRSNLRVNNVPYHQILCTYTDEMGQTHIFKSDPYHPAKCPFIEGQPVKIYVDLRNTDKLYYVSTETVSYL